VTSAFDNLARGWTRGSAIRPVPSYAIVGEAALRRIEEDLADEDAGGPSSMDGAFERFEETQPELSLRIQEMLDRPLDETALALGYFLSIAVWLAFEREFQGRLSVITEDAWVATVDAFALEEDLRRRDANEPLDLDDVLAIEQPAVIAFVHDHIDAARQSGRPYADDASDAGAVAREVDEGDIQLVYRTILLETLALSHAVVPDSAEVDPDKASPELLA
jgi:hypothetical protein